MKSELSKVNLMLMLFVALICLSCKKTTKNVFTSKTKIEEVKNFDLLNSKNFDTIINGKEGKLYWLEKNDIKLAITNY